MKLQRTTEDDVLMMRQQEVEMAQLQREAKATRNLTAEARRDAEEVVVAASASTTRVAANKAQKGVEIAKTREDKTSEDAGRGGPSHGPCGGGSKAC